MNRAIRIAIMIVFIVFLILGAEVGSALWNNFEPTPSSTKEVQL